MKGQCLVVDGLAFSVVIRWYYQGAYHLEPPPAGVSGKRYRLFIPMDYPSRGWFRATRFREGEAEEATDDQLRAEWTFAGEVRRANLELGARDPHSAGAQAIVPRSPNQR